jgi:hypothetical protein
MRQAGRVGKRTCIQSIVTNQQFERNTALPSTYHNSTAMSDEVVPSASLDNGQVQAAKTHQSIAVRRHRKFSGSRSIEISRIYLEKLKKLRKRR